MKPVIKWVGGKTALIPELKQFINKENLGEHRYYEPFIGGGAMAFELQANRTVINDLNKELIHMYLTIRDFPEQVIVELEKLAKMHEENPEYTYYTIRNLDRADDWSWQRTDDTFLKAARTIYLNKTCFNGLYRVNKKGNFNAPLGRTSSGKQPNIVDRDTIMAISDYLNKNCYIRYGSYIEALHDATAGDIVYLDPPYDYEDESGFTSYQKEGWNRSDLEKLYETCLELIRRGVKVVVSNNATTFVKELFSKSNQFQFKEVDCRRNINCKATGRGPVKEVIIYSKNFC